MKTTRLFAVSVKSLSLLAALAGGPFVFGTDLAVTGNLTVTGWINSAGSIDSDANCLTFGKQSTSLPGNPGILLTYADDSMPGGTSDSFTFGVNRSAGSWLWLHNAASTPVKAMRLDSAHQLVVYQADGSTAGVTLTPASNQISLGTATLTGSGTGLTAGGAFTVTGNFTNTNGSFTGGGTGLALNAGGTNQNVTLTPSGSGYTILNGFVGIGTASPQYKLDVRTPGSTAGQIHVASTNTDAGGYLVSSADYNVYLSGGAAYNGSAWVAKNANYGLIGTHNGVVNFFNGSGATVGGTITLAERMRIDTAGNVGIGTTSPANKLDVAGSIGAAGNLFLTASNSQIGFTRNDGTANVGGIGWHSDGYFYLGGHPGYGTAAGSDVRVRGFSSSLRLGTAGVDVLHIAPTGNVGIGATSPGTKLSVNGTIGVGSDEIPISETNFGYSIAYKVLRLGLNQSTRSLALNVDPSAIPGNNFSGAGQILIGNGSVLAPNAAGTDWMGVIRATAGKVYVGGTLSSGEVLGDGLVVSGGNVGIGTTNPTQKLSVAGTVRAYEVIVDTGWSDYVFDEDYRLAPLSEVERHIKAEKHLPGIPSAAEVAADGVSMGAMQSKLLAKVEELTLHLIAQEKRIDRLEAENRALRASVPQANP